MTTPTHVPVMCDEILTLLAPALDRPGAVLVDATLGLGGHTAAALARFPQLRVIGIDRDPQALGLARARLGELAGRFTAVEATYDSLPDVVDAPVDAILFDLGLSSLQIDSPERGFSYAQDAPLSMRMDGDDAALTAADVVNTYSAADLARIFRAYGDEPHARRIADAIVAARGTTPFTTSARLVAVITAAVPPQPARGGHPAKRVFQAVRMEVNDERAGLERALPAALAALRVGGRLAVLSYHSGEDRIVKQLFAAVCQDQAPPGVPVVPERYQAQFTPVTRGALGASPAEVQANPRAQSARLRVVERCKEGV